MNVDKLFEKYSIEVANAVSTLTGVNNEEIYKMLVKLINSKMNMGEDIGEHGEEEEADRAGA